MPDEHPRSDLLTAFAEVGVKLAQHFEIEDMLRTIVQHVLGLTAATYSAAVSVTPEGQIEHFIHTGDAPGEVSGLPHFPEGGGQLGGHVYLGVPMQHKGERVGALFLARPVDAGAFSRDDEQMARGFAALASVGVGNSRLSAAESGRVQRSILLRDIASKVRGSLEVSEVLSTTVETLGRAAKADRCFVRLVEEPGSTSLAPIEYEWDAPGVDSLKDTENAEVAVASLAGETRFTQWSSEGRDEDELLGASTHSHPLDAWTSTASASLSTPIEWGEELIGVITFQTTQAREWSEADVALIEAGAREVAVALNHARLYEQARTTAERHAQLDQMRSDFIAMVSHELRSPMTVVAGIADMFAMKGDELTPELRKEFTDTLGREARRLARLVSEVLDVEAVEQDRLALSRVAVDMAELAKESIVDGGASDRTKLVVQPGDNVIFGDRDKLKQVLLNLISNAAKFSEDPSEIEVAVAPEEGGVRVSVADSGPGIGDEAQSRLFQRFGRAPVGGEQKPGSGLGLFLSRHIIERHGGKIWVHSTPGEGATFSFHLPRSEVSPPS